jgi:hypothetical protein
MAVQGFPNPPLRNRTSRKAQDIWKSRLSPHLFIPFLLISGDATVGRAGKQARKSRRKADGGFARLLPGWGDEAFWQQEIADLERQRQEIQDSLGG